MCRHAEKTFYTVMSRLNGLKPVERIRAVIDSFGLIQQLGMVLSLDDYLFTRQLRELVMSCRRHGPLTDSELHAAGFTLDRLELELCRFARSQEIPDGLARVMALYLLSSYSYNQFNSAGIFEHLAHLGVLYRDTNNQVFVTGLHFKEKTEKGFYRHVPELEAHYVRDCHLSAVDRAFVESLPLLPGYYLKKTSTHERWGTEPDNLNQSQEDILAEWFKRKVA